MRIASQLCSVTLFILSIFFCEYLVSIYFKYYGDRYTFYNPKKHTLPQKRLQQFKRFFDPNLGWVTQFDTEFGERPRKTIYKETLISSYGDSFTHGDEVNSDETWPHYLTEKIQMNILNFGVGAYGPDQSYLRLKQQFPISPTKIVTFGVIHENIKRIVSILRHCYVPHEEFFFTKPRFYFKNKKLTLFPNPLSHTNEFTKLSSPDFIQSLSRYDHWCNRNSLPILKPPYLKIFFHSGFWDQVWFHINNRNTGIIGEPRPWDNLWNDANANDLFYAILDKFMQYVKDQDATPILLLFPTEFDLKNHQINYSKHPFQMIMKHCKKKNYLCLNFHKTLLDQKGNIQKQYFRKWHYSPDGNQAIARSLVKFLELKELL